MENVKIFACSDSADGFTDKICSNLGIEKGKINRIPTSPHKIHRMYFGAFFNTIRSTITASINHPAAILIFSNFKKMFSIPAPPIRLDKTLPYWDRHLNFALSRS